MPSYSEIISRACKAAGDLLLETQETAIVMHKDICDLVTSSDEAAQKAAWKIIHEEFPDHRLLGEETIHDPDFDPGPEDSDFRWIIDPLDGTTNYVHGLPHYCVSIALECRGELLVSCIYAPRYKSWYTAIAGGGARLNGVPLNCSKVQLPIEALGGFGLPFPVNDLTPDYRALKNALPKFQALRRTGSLALNLAYVAQGLFDACWTYSGKPWDVAAGVLLIQEAHGTVSGPRGVPFDLDRAHLIAAGTPELHNQLVNLFPFE